MSVISNYNVLLCNFPLQLGYEVEMLDLKLGNIVASIFTDTSQRPIVDGDRRHVFLQLVCHYF